MDSYIQSTAIFIAEIKFKHIRLAASSDVWQHVNTYLCLEPFCTNRRGLNEPSSIFGRSEWKPRGYLDEDLLD